MIIAEDDPRWDSATMGNRTGLRSQDGWWYENGVKMFHGMPPPGYTNPNTGLTWNGVNWNGMGDAGGVGAMAHAVAEKTARENPGITRKAGTVVSVDAQPTGQYTTVHVAIDGDDPSNTTQVVSEQGVPTIGARVVVSFVPPQGVYMSGTLSNDCDEDWVTFTNSGVVVGEVSPPWGPPGCDAVVFAIETFAGASATTDTTIVVRVDGENQLSFTLGAGESHLDTAANFVLLEHTPTTVLITPGTGLEDCTVTLRFCRNRTGPHTVTPIPPT